MIDTNMSIHNDITLQVHYLTRGTHLKQAHILMLKHAESEVHLPVLITDNEVEALKNAVEVGTFDEIDLALQVLKSLEARIECVRIVPDAPGHYHADVIMLTGTCSKHIMTCSVTKGVCLALRTDCALLMSHSDFVQQQGWIKDNGQVAFPLPAMTDQLLDEALQVAISEENYELAATLHKEIKARQQANRHP